MITTVSQSRLPNISAPRGQLRASTRTPSLPVSPTKNTTSTTSSSLSPSNDLLQTIAQLPKQRLPEVPIVVIDKDLRIKQSLETQGLLPVFLPSPYELGPNGLTIITPKRVNNNRQAK